MKIRGGEIRRFGQYSGVSIPAFGEGVTIVYGDNEAGKSTFLEFLRQTLFGYRRKSGDARYYESRDQQRPFGILDLEDEQGFRYRLERDGYSRSISLFDARENAVPEDVYTQLVHGLTVHAFETIYAFTLDELRNLDQFQNSDLAHVLFGAASGISPAQLRETRTKLTKRADDLFARRGKNRAINALLHDLRDVSSNLKEAQRGQPLYDEKSANLAEVIESISRLKARRCDVDVRLIRARQFKSAWPAWGRLRKATTAIRELAWEDEYAYAAARETLHELQRKLDDTRTQLGEAASDVQSRTREIDSIEVDDRLLQIHPEVEALSEGVAQYREDLRAESILESDMQAGRRRLDEAIAKLGSGWSRERAAGISIPLSIHDRLNELEDAIRIASDQVAMGCKNSEEAAHDAAALKSEVDSLDEQMSSLKESGPIIGDLHLARELRGAVASASKLAGDLLAATADFEGKKQAFLGELQKLQPGWTEVHYRSVNNSLAARRELGDCARQLEQQEETLRRIREEISRLDNSSASNAGQEGTEPERPRFSTADELSAARAGLQQVRTQVAQYIRISEAIALIESQAASTPAAPAGGNSRLVLALVLAVLAVVAGLALISMGQSMEARYPFLVAGLLFLSAAMDWFTSRRTRAPVASGDAGTRMDELRRRQKDLRLTLEAVATSRGLPFSDAIGFLDRYEAAFDDDADAYRLYESARLDKVKRAGQLDELRVRADSVSQSLQSDENAWRTTLEKHGFPRDLRPEYLDAFLSAFSNVGMAEKSMAESHDRLATVNHSLESLRSLARKALPDLSVADDSVQALLDWLGRTAERSLEFGEVAKKAAEARQKHTESISASDSARRTLVENERIYNDAMLRWRNWAQSQGFDSDATPILARKIIPVLESIQAGQKSLEDLKQKTLSTRKRMEQFVTAWESIAARAGRPPATPDTLVADLARLRQDCGVNSQARTKRETAEDELRKAKAREQLLRDSEAETLQRIRELLNQSGCDSVEELARRATIAQQDGQLKEARAAALLQLHDALGDWDSERLDEAFSGVDAATIESDLQELSREADEVDAALLEQASTRTKIEEELRQLQGSDAIIELRQRQEQILAALHQKSREWAAAKLASWIVDESWRRFEREKQPRLFQAASGLISTITGGAYIQIYRSFDDSGDGVIIRTAAGDSKSTRELSRGTREQLYLALRCAHILDQAAEGRVMPVVLDDVLVNFDEKRVRQTLRVMRDVGASTQVFIFTCHRELTRIVSEEIPAASRFALTPAGFEAMS